MTRSGEIRCTELACGVVPDDGQLKAQQSRAVVTSGVLPCACAFAQQSIPPGIPGMWHSRSLECSGIPAMALPPRSAIKAKDVSHFAIAITNSIEETGCLSRLVPCSSDVIRIVVAVQARERL